MTNIMQSKAFDKKTEEMTGKIAKNFEAWEFVERPVDELLTELLYMAHVITSDAKAQAGQRGGNLFDTIATLTQVARDIEHSRITSHFEEKMQDEYIPEEWDEEWDEEFDETEEESI